MQDAAPILLAFLQQGVAALPSIVELLSMMETLDYHPKRG